MSTSPPLSHAEVFQPYDSAKDKALEPLILSVSVLKSWQRCQKQYHYKHQAKLAWPSDQANFRLGKQVHQLLDFQALNLPLTALIANLDADVAKLWATLESHPILSAATLASEWPFHVRLTAQESKAIFPRPVWLHGRLDRIIYNQDKQSVTLIDWKTGTAVPKDAVNAWQTQLYLSAVWEARKQLPNLPFALNRPEQLSFVYVEVKQALRFVKVPFSQEQHNKNMDDLCDIANQLLNQKEFDLPAKCPDRYCPYNSVCGINQGLLS